MKRPKLLIFVVAYNVAAHIESVLDRIPQDIWDQKHYDTEILIIDDASKDKTAELSHLYKMARGKSQMTVLSNPTNQGYGGNQKIGYHYAIQHGFDIVALLHGDGQYAPEMLPTLIEPIAKGECSAVFGSRMLKKSDALKGGMPLYKWLGNQVLTWAQNKLLGSDLSEFHSGYRIYSVESLKKVPFEYNSNRYDFDTDIIIQFLDNGLQIREIAIPTYYGDEISYLNGVQYAKDIVRTTVLSRVQRFHIFYNPKFDYTKAATAYESKLEFPSSHRFAVDQVAPGSVVLDLGCGSGHVARELIKRGCAVHCVGEDVPEDLRAAAASVQEGRLEDIDIRFKGERLDAILLLDVIERLEYPEKFLRRLRDQFCRYSPRVVITTGNVAFGLERASMLIGQFNYGRKGILDLTHRRLYTIRSLKRALVNAGLAVDSVSGIPAPLPLAFGRNAFSGILLNLNRWLIGLSNSLFAFELGIVAHPTMSLEALLENATENMRQVLEDTQAKIA